MNFVMVDKLVIIRLLLLAGLWIIIYVKNEWQFVISYGNYLFNVY